MNKCVILHVHCFHVENTTLFLRYFVQNNLLTLNLILSYTLALILDPLKIQWWGVLQPACASYS